MKRRQARENAVAALFEMSFGINDIRDIIETSRENDEFCVNAYGEKLINYFLENSCEVDDAIKARLKDWKIERLPRVNVAILRICVAEMMMSEENIDSIVINEAVEISKKYAGENDYQFINGVLGVIAKDLHGEQVVTAQPDNTEDTAIAEPSSGED